MYAIDMMSIMHWRCIYKRIRTLNTFRYWKMFIVEKHSQKSMTRRKALKQCWRVNIKKNDRKTKRLWEQQMNDPNQTKWYWHHQTKRQKYDENRGFYRVVAFKLCTQSFNERNYFKLNTLVMRHVNMSLALFLFFICFSLYRSLYIHIHIKLQLNGLY